MTKRLFGVVKGHREHIADHTGRLYSDSEVADLLNTVYENCNMYREDALKAEKDKEKLLEENKQLKEQREKLFFRERDTKNRWRELKQENEQLKKDVEYWKQVASQYSNELNVWEHYKKYKTECKDIYHRRNDE